MSTQQQGSTTQQDVLLGPVSSAHMLFTRAGEIKNIWEISVDGGWEMRPSIFKRSLDQKQSHRQCIVNASSTVTSLMHRWCV